jgi:hypothetical protein
MTALLSQHSQEELKLKLQPPIGFTAVDRFMEGFGIRTIVAETDIKAGTQVILDPVNNVAYGVVGVRDIVAVDKKAYEAGKRKWLQKYRREPLAALGGDTKLKEKARSRHELEKAMFGAAQAQERKKS